MYEWMTSKPGDIAALVSVLAFLLSLGTLAVSAFRYVQGLREKQEKERFEAYHRLLRIVSTGHDEQGILKLVSQIAYIHELTNFRRYDPVTYRTLRYLRKDWAERDPAKRGLLGEVDRAIARIERRRFVARLLGLEAYSDVRA